jgi:phosphoadenosine phosphosulfate reductase
MSGIPASLLNASTSIELLGAALMLYTPRIALASSFSLEDVTLIHMLSLFAAPDDYHVIALDTGRLPEETYQCAEAIRNRYHIAIEWLYPDKDLVEELLLRKGAFSFKESVENRHECCFIRKVQPLQQRLKTLDAWITGQRREQSSSRSALEPVEFDVSNNSMIKLNPLWAWTAADVSRYVKENNIPYSALYDRGYKSIGCQPCTRPVAAEEHERAGRWWWEAAEHKECGIHLAPVST